jgi:hypothetical protein
MFLHLEEVRCSAASDRVRLRGVYESRPITYPPKPEDALLPAAMRRKAGPLTTYSALRIHQLTVCGTQSGMLNEGM